MGELSPNQSADVILYYYRSLDEDVRKSMKLVTAFARASIYATRSEESILPVDSEDEGRKPMIDYPEMIHGLDYLLLHIPKDVLDKHNPAHKGNLGEVTTAL